jgi:hypothetical protein
MKHLLLYFLFFVGAAFVFIQCAKFFPTKDESPKHPAKSQKNTGQTFENNPDKARFFAVNNNIIKRGLRTKAFISYFDNPVFPFYMVRYIKGNSIFNNRQFGFIYTDIYGNPLYPYVSFTYNHIFDIQNGDMALNNLAVQKQ